MLNDFVHEIVKQIKNYYTKEKKQYSRAYRRFHLELSDINIFFRNKLFGQSF